MRRRVAVLAVSIAVAGGFAAFVPTTATAGPGFTNNFSLTSRQTNYEVGYAANPTEAAQFNYTTGDTVVIRHELTRGSTVVGFGHTHCTATFDNYLLCTNVGVYPGEGTLSGTALVHIGPMGPEPFDVTVTGGTGSFANKRGYFHQVESLPLGTTDYHLVG